MSKSETIIGKQFWKELGLAPGNMRIAKEQQLSEILGLQRGNVNPFSLSNDSGNRVTKLILDANLETSEYLAFHPMDNTATVELKRSEFDKFLEAVNRKV